MEWLVIIVHATFKELYLLACQRAPLAAVACVLPGRAAVQDPRGVVGLCSMKLRRLEYARSPAVERLLMFCFGKLFIMLQLC